MALLDFLQEFLPDYGSITGTVVAARRAFLSIQYDGTDISADIAEHLISASIKDTIGGEADTLDITLEDRAGLWAGDWLPTRGATITATLILIGWTNDSSEIQLPLGVFYVDEIALSGGGSATSSVEMNTISVPDGVARDVARTRSWEKVQLQVVANDLAKSAGLELTYDTKENPTLDRLEQTDESDLAFLHRVCTDNGLCLKVSNKKVVIFDEAKYDEQASIATIDKYDMTEFESYNFHTKVREIYNSCTVTYQKSRDKQKIEATFDAPAQEGNKLTNTTEKKVLRINQEVQDVGAALRLAKKELYNKNKEETTGTLELKGRPDLYAGGCVDLVNFGAFSGKYLITEVNTDVGGNYKISLSVRRALVGYA